jgi:hypothetical protein
METQYKTRPVTLRRVILPSNEVLEGNVFQIDLKTKQFAAFSYEEYLRTKERPYV